MGAFEIYYLLNRIMNQWYKLQVTYPKNKSKKKKKLQSQRKNLTLLGKTYLQWNWGHRNSTRKNIDDHKGHVPKINERGYWYTLWIQGALPLTQPLLKYFDQKSYREWYGTSQNWVKMTKFTCFLYILRHFMNKNDKKPCKKHVNLVILTQFWDVPYHSR